jgi:hypothetical protein
MRPRVPMLFLPRALRRLPGRVPGHSSSMSIHSVRAWFPYLAAFAIATSQLPVLVALRTILTGKARMGGGLHREILAATLWIGTIELLALVLAGFWIWYRARHRAPVPAGPAY